MCALFVFVCDVFVLFVLVMCVSVGLCLSLCVFGGCVLCVNCFSFVWCANIDVLVIVYVCGVFGWVSVWCCCVVCVSVVCLLFVW